MAELKDPREPSAADQATNAESTKRRAVDEERRPIPPPPELFAFMVRARSSVVNL